MFGLFEKRPRQSMHASAQNGIRDIGRSILAAAEAKETDADIARLQLAAEKWVESLLPDMPEDLRGEMRHVLKQSEHLMTR